MTKSLKAKLLPLLIWCHHFVNISRVKRIKQSNHCSLCFSFPAGSLFICSLSVLQTKSGPHWLLLGNGNVMHCPTHGNPCFFSTLLGESWFKLADSCGVDGRCWAIRAFLLLSAPCSLAWNCKEAICRLGLPGSGVLRRLWMSWKQPKQFLVSPAGDEAAAAVHSRKWQGSRQKESEHWAACCPTAPLWDLSHLCVRVRSLK